MRSDLHVSFEERASGGIEIDLRSRVELYYGEVIRQQVRDVLRALGVEHAFLEIVDEGALPFVIAARIEAAVRRAGLGQGKSALPEAVPLPAPSARDRLRRSRLYLPGNEPKYFINAGLHAPDAIILDLEDSVHHAEKDAARLLVRNALRAVDFGAAERMVRINQLPLGLADLEEIVPQSPDLILIPKVETAEQVSDVVGAIDSIAQRAGITRPIWLMPILESALGIENAFAIATASDRIAGITIGLEDYTADLGVAKTAERQRVALRAPCEWSTPRTPRMCRPSIRSTATSPTPTACCAGARPRAPWASKAWAACIPSRSRSSIAPLLPQRQSWRRRWRSSPPTKTRRRAAWAW